MGQPHRKQLRIEFLSMGGRDDYAKAAGFVLRPGRVTIRLVQEVLPKLSGHVQPVPSFDCGSRYTVVLLALLHDP